MDSPMLTLLVARRRDARHLEDACVLVNYLGNLVVHTESGVTEQRLIRVLQHGTLCK